MPAALICEDDRAIRSLIESLLRREGFVVESAADGRDAMMLLDEHTFDVIVLDLMMPQMTGEAIIRHIEERRPQLLSRIVVTTAAINRSRELQAHAVGAVVTKPFDLREFVGTIHGIARGVNRRND